MRILIVTIGDPAGVASLGGAERQAALLAREMLNHGHEVRVLCIADCPGAATDFMDLLDIPYKLFKKRITRRIIHNLNFIGITKEINVFKPEAILSYTTMANIYSGLASLFTYRKFKLVWGQRDAGLGYNGGNIFNLIRNQFTCYVSNSTEGAKYMENSLNLAPQKIKVIYNGILLPERSAEIKYRSLYNITSQDVVCTMVANLTKNKDHQTLIKAFAIVHQTLKQQQKKSYLLLAGRKEVTYNSLLELTKQLNLTDSVKFLDAIPDVSQLLSESDIMVHSSPSEGVSNAILEAMAIGLPIIATDILGNRECLGPNALPETLTPVGDSNLMAQKIIDLITNPIHTKYIIDANYKRVKNTFSVGSMYNNYTQILSV